MRSDDTRDDTLSKTLSKLFVFSKTYVYIFYLGNIIHIERESYKIPSIPDYKRNVCACQISNYGGKYGRNGGQSQKPSVNCDRSVLTALPGGDNGVFSENDTLLKRKGH